MELTFLCCVSKESRSIFFTLMPRCPVLVLERWSLTPLSAVTPLSLITCQYRFESVLFFFIGCCLLSCENKSSYLITLNNISAILDPLYLQTNFRIILSNYRALTQTYTHALVCEITHMHTHTHTLGLHLISR